MAGNTTHPYVEMRLVERELQVSVQNTHYVCRWKRKIPCMPVRRDKWSVSEYIHSMLTLDVKVGPLVQCSINLLIKL